MKFLRNLGALALLWLLVGQPAAQAQWVSWMRAIPQPGPNRYHQNMDLQSTADRNGNVFVWGQYTGNVYCWGLVCGGPNNNGYEYNACLFKYDRHGSAQWVLNSTSDGEDEFLGGTTDAAGNVYALLRVQLSINNPNGTLTFSLGGQPISGAGMYLVKVNAAGTVQYARRLTGYPDPGTSYNPALVVDAAGDCFLSSTGATVYRMSAAGVFSTFCALTLRPNPRFSGSPTGFAITDLAMGLQGDIYCAGRLQGLLIIGADTIRPNSSGGPGCAVRIGANGTPVWARCATMGTTPSTSAYTFGETLAADANGDLYMNGQVSSTAIAFGGIAQNNSPLDYLVKFTRAGQVSWLRSNRQLAGASPVNSGLVAGRVVVDSLGNVYKSASHFGDTLLVDGVRYPHAAANKYHLFSYTSGGTLRWLRNYPMYNRYSETIKALFCDHTGALTLMATAEPNVQIDQGSSMTVFYEANNFMRLEPGATLQGTVYLDSNGNGQRDPGEGPFPQSVVLTEASGQLYGNSLPDTGEYQVFGLAGPYNLAPTVPAHYAVSQPATGTRTGSFPAGGQRTTGLDFGLRPIANQPDVRVSLTPYGNARPGFITKYRLTVENTGTTNVANGTASVVLDTHATYVSSAPAGTYASTSRTVSWTYPSLAPLARLNFDVQFSLPVNVTAGTLLSSLAEAALTGDLVPADNTVTETQPVTSSFDPNDIQVNYSRLSPTQLAAGQPLDYTVRFQNMGTDTAFTVVLHDSLRLSHLLPSSLQLVAQSHNCVWTLNQQGQLTVRFPNAKLPARATNILASQGFVRFRIQPRSSLPVGAIIPNDARIVFDFNAPVATNTATTAVLMPTAVLHDRQALAWAAYPNPATEALNIEAELPSAGTVQLQLLDVLGRPVQQRQLPAPAGAFRQTLDLSGQAPGLYVLRLTLPDGRSSTRTVERK